MKGIAEIGGRHLTAVHILAIALVDNNAVGNLHDTALYALQFVASTCQLNKQEEIHHRMTGGLALPHSNRFNENLVETCSLAEDNGLTRFTGNTTEGACRWRRTNECLLSLREFFHACLVAQDTSLAALAGRVDCQYCQFAAGTLQHMDAKLINAGTFSGTRHTADTDAHGVAAVRQAFVDDFLSLGVMIRVNALHQGDGLREDGDVTFDDTLHHLRSRIFTTAEMPTLQVGVNDTLTADAGIDLQPLVFFTVLWMFHIRLCALAHFINQFLYLLHVHVRR